MEARRAAGQEGPPTRTPTHTNLRVSVKQLQSG